MNKLIVLLAMLIGIVATPVWAAPNCDQNGNDCVQLTNALPSVSSVPQLIGTVIRGALGVIGALTLLMFIWGGFQWLISAGNAEKVQKGTQTMLWAAVGVVIVFSSYFLVSQLTTLLHK